MPEDRATQLAVAVGRETGRSAAGLVPETRESDREMMSLAQKGDREAYGRLFQRRAPGLWQMAYLLLHDADAAEDVVQEAFTQGLQHLGEFRGESEPKGWFCAIALNVCRQMWRRQRNRESLAEASQLEAARPVGAPRRGVLTSLLRHETNRRLAVALGYLSEGQREVFVLHYVEELPYEAIAAILGTTSGAARALSHRAREVLQEKLQGDAPGSA
jgi:RNA polymerase sigma-70 factor (ECF subfamily)